MQLATDILDFIAEVDPFYGDRSLPTALEIRGAWGGDLRARRKNQIEAYEKRDSTAVASLHSRMFFNELVSGLWNHAYWQDRNSSRARLAEAQKEIEHVKSVWPEFESFSASTKVPNWGFGLRGSQDVLKTMVSAWHFTQMKLVENSSRLMRGGASGVLEIGSGFGGLAELLALANSQRKILLVDIPLNLTTCYFYLRQSLPESVSVVLHSNASSIGKAKAEDSEGVHLIPSCFYSEVSDWPGVGLACNFASFSEMDLATVNYYMERLPSETSVILQINSNLEKQNTDAHLEVAQDRFRYPEAFEIVHEGPVFGNTRYKASVRIRH